MFTRILLDEMHNTNNTNKYVMVLGGKSEEQQRAIQGCHENFNFFLASVKFNYGYYFTLVIAKSNSTCNYEEKIPRQ